MHKAVGVVRNGPTKSEHQICARSVPCPTQISKSSFGEPSRRCARRILHLAPRLGTPGSVWRVAALRHDALAQLAGWRKITAASPSRESEKRSLDGGVDSRDRHRCARQPDAVRAHAHASEHGGRRHIARIGRQLPLAWCSRSRVPLGEGGLAFFGVSEALAGGRH
jgi:hypothetical protein